MSMDFKAWTILSGAAGSSGYFFFAAELDKVAKEDTSNSTFFVYDVDQEEDGGFGKFDEIVGWPAISLATIKPPGAQRLVVAIAPDGHCWELEPSTGEERTAPIPGPFNLRRLAVIDQEIYACGMNRVVLKREGFTQWRSLGPGGEAGDPAIVGFEAIGGFSETELYAVGWGGEIWWCDTGTWRRVASPTQANLTALLCASDGQVYAVGHGGVLVRGRRDQWQAIETSRREDLRDVAEFEGQIHAVTDAALLRLSADGLVPETDFADAQDRPSSCLHLLAAPDGLVSLGQKDVFLKDDGPWRRLI